MGGVLLHGQEAAGVRRAGDERERIAKLPVCLSAAVLARQHPEIVCWHQVTTTCVWVKWNRAWAWTGEVQQGGSLPECSRK